MKTKELDEFVVGNLIIRGIPNMNKLMRSRISDWLKEQAQAVIDKYDKIDGRYVAKYIVHGYNQKY